MAATRGCAGAQELNAVDQSNIPAAVASQLSTVFTGGDAGDARPGVSGRESRLSWTAHPLCSWPTWSTYKMVGDDLLLAGVTGCAQRQASMTALPVSRSDASLARSWGVAKGPQMLPATGEKSAGLAASRCGAGEPPRGEPCNSCEYCGARCGGCCVAERCGVVSREPDGERERES